MDELPIGLDDQDEPSISAIEHSGLCVCAVIAEMSDDRGETISAAFRQHGAKEWIKLYAWSHGVESYVRLNVGTDSINYHCKNYSHMFIALLDPETRNIFFRHLENDLLLFVGSESFVQACLRILSRPISHEMELVIKESNFFDEARARFFFNRFLNKYNRLPTFVGP